MKKYYLTSEKIFIPVSIRYQTFFIIIFHKKSNNSTPPLSHNFLTSPVRVP